MAALIGPLLFMYRLQSELLVQQWNIIVTVYSAIGVNVADFGIYTNIGVSSGINVIILEAELE